MRRYACPGDQTATAADSVVSIGNGAAVTFNAALYELMISSHTDAPADAALRFSLKRYTAAGTSTAVTPEPLNNADPAAISDGGSNHTVEPTYAGVAFLDFGINQRNTFRWVATPDGEIFVPLAKSCGLGLQNVHVSAGTPALDGMIHFSE